MYQKYQCVRVYHGTNTFGKIVPQTAAVVITKMIVQ